MTRASRSRVVSRSRVCRGVGWRSGHGCVAESGDVVGGTGPWLRSKEIHTAAPFSGRRSIPSATDRTPDRRTDPGTAVGRAGRPRKRLARRRDFRHPNPVGRGSGGGVGSIVGRAGPGAGANGSGPGGGAAQRRRSASCADAGARRAEVWSGHSLVGGVTDRGCRAAHLLGDPAPRSMSSASASESSTRRS